MSRALKGERPLTEGFVRQVFSRPISVNIPLFVIHDDTDTGHTYDIRPPKGVLWKLNYAQIFLVDPNASACTAIIQLYDGTQTAILAEAVTTTARTSISFGSFGNGPLVLSNDVYLQLSTSCAASRRMTSVAAYEVI